MGGGGSVRFQTLAHIFFMASLTYRLLGIGMIYITGMGIGMDQSPRIGISLEQSP